ncbi:Oligopeptidase A [hydrothermal vent metagenome]|uniref:oligopeptidase A n=1 Tax=hydrothermal vent metagenome TaxID=652676 RepID=A0A3B0Z7F8_9ZZZZ
MNPLLELTELPAFDRILPEHVEPAVDQTLAGVREQIESLLQAGPPFSWDNTLAPLELALNRLHRVWSPVSHLNAVMNSDALRAAYNTCLPKLSAFETELGQHEELYRAVKAIADSDAFEDLNSAQQQSIRHRLRDFRLMGIELDPEGQARFKDIQQRLSELQSRFQENLLDATHGWKKSINDETLLSGLPESARDLARQQAESEQQEGWLFTLDFPSYFPVMAYADNRALREEFYTAYLTRASDAGPHAGQWDNSEIMDEILALRHESARLLDFGNYAEYSLATKMADSPQQVLQFLEELAEHAAEPARQDMRTLRDFAREQGADYDLQAWDVPYWSEKLRQQRHDLSQEMLKPWFPDTRVIQGLFDVTERLYGMHVSERHDVALWHPDVRFFEIHDAGGTLRGRFYLDLYARADKRGGAWMDDCASRLMIDEQQQVPVAYLTCNFSPPLGEAPALLTHNEVTTLFHEFGHGLHHLLTRVDYPSVSGINGVAWDAVELPSQFMENWCWEREPLNLISAQVETGEPLPDTLFERMRGARNFQSAMQMVRQLEFALFDMRIHLEYQPGRGGRIYEKLNQVREQVAVIPAPDFNRFAHGFSHIFGGGYAAGYYSYKWAEVLSADAYSLFEETGVFSRESGERFLDNILEQGGSADPMQLYRQFRGREPDIRALLRHSGLEA